MGDHIIIELGTNGPFAKDQLRSLLTSLTEAKEVLVVTTRVPEVAGELRKQMCKNKFIEDSKRE